MVLHPTQVHILRYVDTYHRRNTFLGNKDTVTFFHEVVGYQTEFVEQAQFETYVGFLGGFPCHVRVTRVTGCDTLYPCYRVTEVITGSACVHFGVVGETAAATDFIVTDLSVRTFELQKADDIGYRFPELFVTDHVSQCARREETETVSRGEVFGTVVTEVEFSEVFVAE